MLSFSKDIHDFGESIELLMQQKYLGGANTG